jgi:hypothetical protein
MFLAVVHNLSVGEDGGSPDLQALELIGRLGSATSRRRILGRGLLLIALGLLLLVSCLFLAVGTRLEASPTS